MVGRCARFLLTGISVFVNGEGRRMRLYLLLCVFDKRERKTWEKSRRERPTCWQGRKYGRISWMAVCRLPKYQRKPIRILKQNNRQHLNRCMRVPVCMDVLEAGHSAFILRFPSRHQGDYKKQKERFGCCFRSFSQTVRQMKS